MASSPDEHPFVVRRAGSQVGAVENEWQRHQAGLVVVPGGMVAKLWKKRSENTSRT